MTACDKFEQAILEFGVKAAIEYFDAPEYVAKRLNANWEKQVRESENEDRAIIQQQVQPDNAEKEIPFGYYPNNEFEE